MADFSRWLDRYLPEGKDLGDKKDDSPSTLGPSLPHGPDAFLRLDLHGATRDQVRGMIDRALRAALEQGYGNVLIIHGKGNNSSKGPVLVQEVRDCLESHPLAGEQTQAPARLGGSGATLVKVRIKGKRTGR